MAHIPYGYRIVQGKAVAAPEEAQKIRQFIRNYLAGSSIRQAAQEAGMVCSQDQASHILRRELYTGDGYYPPILSRETFDEVQAELKRRTHSGKREAEPAIPIRRKFRLQLREEAGSEDALRRFEEAYSMIKAAEDGGRTQSREEQELLTQWQKEPKNGR